MLLVTIIKLLQVSLIQSSW